MAYSENMRLFNVGVVGYGMSAKIFHIPFIKLTSGLSLHSIVQRSPTAENSAPQDHPDAKHYTSIGDLVSDAEVDLVVISTPPDSHYQFVRTALEAGKHVLVEKPFVPTSREADELAALAREKGKLLCIYQNRRWDADFVTVKKLVEDGELGRVYEFETHFDRYRPEKPTNWKARLRMDQGGGVIFDLGTHLLDQVYVLFGMPSSVSAKFVNQREGKLVKGNEDEEPDSVNAILGYESRGLLVHVRIGVMSVEVRQTRFWVRGTKGSYVKHGLDPQEDQLKAGKAGTEPDFGRHPASSSAWNGVLARVFPDGAWEEREWPNVEPPPTYREFYRRLEASLRSEREADVPVPAAQAADVLRIIEAVRKSAMTGKDVAPSPRPTA